MSAPAGRPPRTTPTREKARDSLSAGEVLIEAKHYDSAASRLYYALYQAACIRMERLGKKPTDFKLSAADDESWPHDTIAGNAILYRNNNRDEVLFRRAHANRVQADYKAEQVSPSIVTQIATECRTFIEATCS